MSITYVEAMAELERLLNEPSLLTKQSLMDLVKSISIEQRDGSQPTVTLLYSGSASGISYVGTPGATAQAIADSTDRTIATINGTHVANFLSSDLFNAAVTRACAGDANPADAVNDFKYSNAPGSLGAWSVASEAFASAASGEIVTYTPFADPGRAFSIVEMPAILDNPKIEKINGIDVAVFRQIRDSAGLEEATKAVNASSADLWNWARVVQGTDVDGKQVQYVGNVGDVLSKIGLDGPTLDGTFVGYVKSFDFLPNLDPDTASKNLQNLLDGARHLEKFGAVGTLAAVLILAADMQERLDAGDEAGAADLFGEFLVSETGAALGGIVGGAIVGILIGALAATPPGWIVGGLVLVGGLIGSIIGDAIGDSVYDASKDLISDLSEWLVDQGIASWLAEHGVMEWINNLDIVDWLEEGGAFFNPPISPLVLDLDGDGVELTLIDESTAHFDLNENGLAEKTAWISADDGFLAHDLNHNGVIDDLSELFGGQDVDGFTRLAAHDLNKDGVINAADTVFSELKLWRDNDGDGVTDSGELSGLAENGVTSINLDATPVNEWVEGNWISHRSVFTRSDGSTGMVDDVWFENDQVRTIDRSVTPSSIPDNIALLPELVGYGSLSNLSVELTRRPELVTALQDLILEALSKTPQQLRSEIENFLLRWAEVDGIAVSSRGGIMDARHLTFLEAIHGQGFIAQHGTPDPRQNASAALEAYYDRIMDSLTAKIAVQLPLSTFWLTGNHSAANDHPLAILSLFTYHELSDRIYLSGINKEILEDKLVDALRADSITEVLEYLSVLTDFKTDTAFAGQTAAEWVAATLKEAGASGSLLSFLDAAASAASVHIGTSGMDTLSGGNQSDALAGGAGNDTLSGGGGDDTYYWSHGDGADTITEGTNNGSADKLVLNGVLPGELTFERSGTDITLVIGESSPGAGDAGSVLLRNNLDEYYSQGVDSITFADGTIWTRATLRAKLLAPATEADDVLYGSSVAETINGLGGNDSIRAGSGNDRIDGGSGADVLFGGGGNDTFVFRPDSGADIVKDFQVHNGSTASDYIELVGTEARTFTELMATATELEDVVYLNTSANSSIALHGVGLDDLGEQDFKFL